MKQLLSCFVLLVSSLFFGQNLRAQTPVIELDTLTLSPSAPLPFDQPFILKVPISSSNISYVFYIKHNGNKTLAESFDSKRHVVPVEIKTFTVKKQGTQNYLLVTIDDPNLLDPGKTYSFIFLSRIGEVAEAFDSYRKYAVDATKTKDRDHAAEVATKLGTDYFNEFGFNAIFVQNDQCKNLKILKFLYENHEMHLDSLYKVYENALTVFGNGPVTALPQGINMNAGLVVLKHLIAEHTNAVDPTMKPILLKDPKAATIRINKLAAIDTTLKDYQDLVYGIVPLDCDDCKPADVQDYDTRMQNIKDARSYLNELNNFAQTLDGIQALGSAVTLFNQIITDLNNSQKSVKNLLDARKPILDALIAMDLGIINIVSGTSIIKDFDSRNKLSIAPDFGLVTTKLFETNNPYGFVPYLGFHINLRPLNRDIPWKSYDHKNKFLGYWSLFVGWSLVNVTDGPHLTAKADSIGGFFSNTKGTLMTGLGFRLGNAARITFGSMYYFKYSALNPATPTFYDSRKLKAWPFIGLSLDLALKDLLNGVNDAFSSAPRSYNPPRSSSN